jgi:hypothetical protein
VYVEPAMAAYADLYLPKERVSKEPPLAPWREGERAWLLAEGKGAFHREHGALWDLARQRYFDVSLRPVPAVRFGEGWYGEEEGSWRWMGRRSVMAVPAGKLTLQLYVPLDALKEPPLITIGNDTFRASAANIERTYDDVSGLLVIETNEVLRTPNDPRELGVRLNGLKLELH